MILLEFTLTHDDVIFVSPSRADDAPHVAR